MYIFSPDEIRMIHEERIAELANDRSAERKNKLTPTNPVKWAMKLFKQQKSR